MQRTSSTAQLALAKVALDALGVPYVDMGYWAMEAHVLESSFPKRERQQYRLKQANMQAQLDRTSVVLYKSHDYSSRLVGFCDHHVVLQSRRCVPNMLRSWTSLNWVDSAATSKTVRSSSAQGTQLERWLNASLAHYGRWLDHGGLVQDAWRIQSLPEISALEIASFLAQRLRQTRAPLLRDEAEARALVSGMAESLRGVEANPTIPSQHQRPDPQVDKAVFFVQQHLEAWGMDPLTRLGLRWECDRKELDHHNACSLRVAQEDRSAPSLAAHHTRVCLPSDSRLSLFVPLSQHENISRASRFGSGQVGYRIDVPADQWWSQCDVLIRLAVTYVNINTGSVRSFVKPKSLATPATPGLKISKWPAERTVTVFSSEKCGQYYPFDAYERAGARFVQYMARTDAIQTVVYLPLAPHMNMPYTNASSALRACASSRPFLFNLIVSANTNNLRLQWIGNATTWLNSTCGFVFVLRKWIAHDRRVNFGSVSTQGCGAQDGHYSDVPLSYSSSRDAMLCSAFTLSPSGNAFECYRWFEAAEVGSIPVITKAEMNLAASCSFELLESAPFLIVPDVRDALVEMKRLAEQPEVLDARSRAVRQWYDQFVSHTVARSEGVFREIAAAAAVAMPGTKQTLQMAPAPTFTLLVSHFAMTVYHPHHAEIEAAIRANLLQPSLVEVWVWYDEQPGDGCPEFKERLASNRAWKNEWGRQGRLGGAAKLTCKGRFETQPTYLQVFNYASSQSDGPFAGSHVVVANADVVFDKTLLHLSKLGFTPNKIWVMSITHHADKQLYNQTLGMLPYLRNSSTVKQPFLLRCNGYLEVSWDAWAFRPPLPPLETVSGILNVLANRPGAESRVKCGALHPTRACRMYQSLV